MSAEATSTPCRLALIDTVKGLAAQLIVLHHLAFYGPMSDTAFDLAPATIAWLYDYGRIAVQVFLVVAGFLAARSLAPDGILRPGSPLPTIWRRYLGLALPLLAALVVAIVAATLARQMMQHDTIPAPPTLAQLVAHVLLLHGISGSDSLSAGVWYLAIDFQLFILLAALLALARRLSPTPQPALWLVGALALAAMFHFNRQPKLDDWGIYFFGAYGLGAFAYWSAHLRAGRLAFVALGVAALIALTLDFRLRLLVALIVASLLALATWRSWLDWPHHRLFGWLGQISFALFLIHFPIILIVGASLHVLAPTSPAANLLGMLGAWALSLAAAALFHRLVEENLRRRT